MNSKNYIKQLKEILEKRNISQSALASEIGVTFSAFNRWINKYSTPHKTKLEKINKLYKEYVYYPEINQEAIKQIIKGSEKFKIKNIYKRIVNNEKLIEDLLLEHTYNSNAIEGSTFSKRETEAVIFDHLIIKEKSLIEHLEATNHATVLRNIFGKKYGQEIDESLIKNLHKDLMQSIRQDAGEYSKYNRAIRGVNIMLTHPDDIPEELEKLILKWKEIKNKNIHDIAKFHADFELIHPFGDGNGRVGRLLMIIQCLSLDYPPVVIENSEKIEYYEVLEYAQTKTEGPLVEFFFSEMKKTRGILDKY